jgi:hypothetical protein
MALLSFFLFTVEVFMTFARWDQIGREALVKEAYERPPPQ